MAHQRQPRASRRRRPEKETFFIDQAEVSDEGVLVGGDPNSGLDDVEILPGSFIATRRNEVSTLGVALGSRFHAGREAIVMFTPTGEVWYPFRDDITFILPSFISANMTARCGMDEVAQSDTELNARMEVLKRLRKLVHELEAKSSSRQLGPDVWEKFRPKDPSAWGESRDPLHFVAKHPYLVTQTFLVRPQAEVELIEKVLAWKREDDPRLGNFAEKAKPIIAETSKRVKESALEPPTQQATTPVWNEDDKTIIRFLQSSLRQTRSNQGDPYLIARSAIMRLLDPTHPLFTEADVAQVLVNLGVFSPWQDLCAIQPPIAEPEYNPESAMIARQEGIAKRSLSHKPKPGAPLGPEDFYPSDPLEAVRHDFGDLPVFVIDEATAQELDDGVSIESIPSEPGSYWLHAHIANPTATLPPTHIFAIDAMRQGITQYLQHHTVPLFPPSLMYHPELGWSLGSQKDKPSKVITFSAKIDSSGELVDHKVRAGVVNKVRVISYNAVNKILGYDPVASGDLRRPLGGPLVNEEAVEVPDLSESELDALRTIYKVSQTLQENWCRKYVVRPGWDKAETVFGDFPAGSMTPFTEGRSFRGFPEFKDYIVRSAESADRGSMGLVQEVMKVAGRVGSRFALEHNLPMIRRAMLPPMLLTPELTEELKALRKESGSLEMWHAMTRMGGLYSASYTLEPREHYHIGAPLGEGYTRMTSPLRRALDLVGHWQLHSALLGEAKPMFDVDWMERFKVDFGVMEGQVRKLSENHNSFWVGQFLKKWKEGELRGDGFVPYDPHRTYEAHVMTKGWPMFDKNAKAYMIAVPELGLAAKLEAGVTGEIPFGATIPAKLADIDVRIKTSVKFALSE
ncbi:hypothetical protein NMY22_g13475 [Coprinellus aureogranulatus]|nr:hypothetical protein NMY22_g13475 [Coprinellus aureogranulatus]